VLVDDSVKVFNVECRVSGFRFLLKFFVFGCWCGDSWDGMGYFFGGPGG
jgi:hypothetical protein